MSPGPRFWFFRTSLGPYSGPSFPPNFLHARGLAWRPPLAGEIGRTGLDLDPCSGSRSSPGRSADRVARRFFAGEGFPARKPRYNRVLSHPYQVIIGDPPRDLLSRNSTFIYHVRDIFLRTCARGEGSISLADHRRTVFSKADGTQISGKYEQFNLVSTKWN